MASDFLIKYSCIGSALKRHVLLTAFKGVGNSTCTWCIYDTLGREACIQRSELPAIGCNWGIVTNSD